MVVGRVGHKCVREREIALGSKRECGKNDGNSLQTTGNWVAWVLQLLGLQLPQHRAKSRGRMVLVGVCK